MRTTAPVSPGEMLEEEFLKPLGLTKYRLAKDTHVTPTFSDPCSGRSSTYCHVSEFVNFTIGPVSAFAEDNSFSEIELTNFNKHGIFSKC